MLLFRLNGLRAAGAARGIAHCAALQTMHLSAHCVGGSAPTQLCSNFFDVYVFASPENCTLIHAGTFFELYTKPKILIKVAN